MCFSGDASLKDYEVKEELTDEAKGDKVSDGNHCAGGRERW
jgi:hypothetical protein